MCPLSFNCYINETIRWKQNGAGWSWISSDWSNLVRWLNLNLSGFLGTDSYGKLIVWRSWEWTRWFFQSFALSHLSWLDLNWIRNMNEDTVDAVEGLVLTALLYEKKTTFEEQWKKNPQMPCIWNHSLVLIQIGRNVLLCSLDINRKKWWLPVVHTSSFSTSACYLP